MRAGADAPNPPIRRLLDHRVARGATACGASRHGIDDGYGVRVRPLRSSRYMYVARRSSRRSSFGPTHERLHGGRYLLLHAAAARLADGAAVALDDREAVRHEAVSRPHFGSDDLNPLSIERLCDLQEQAGTIDRL